MKINKYIFLLGLMFFISASIFAQVGRGKIVLSTGDTVLVVKQQSFLTAEDIKFLRKDTLKRETIMDMKSDYNSLEAAALDLDKLLGEINVSQSLSKQNNESLSVRLATRNLRNLKKEKQARNTWDSIMAQEPTIKDLTDFYELFGDKPSYFINGILVEEQTVNRLRPSEILNRNLRTIDTATGNPNGEIWYEVSGQTLRKLGFVPATNDTEIKGIRIISSPDPDDNTSTTPAVIEKQEPVKTETPRQEPSKQQEPLPAYTPRFKVIEKDKEKKEEPVRSVRRIKERQAQD